MTLAWRESRPGLSAVFVFSVFINLLKFATPLYLLQVLDRVPASRSIETLVMLTVITLAAVGAGMALDVVRRRMLIRWGVWIERRFGPLVVHRGLVETEGGPDTERVERALGDVARLRNFASNHIANWLDLVWTPFFFLGVFLIHPLLGTITLIALGLLVILGILQDRLTREPRSRSSEANREASDLVQSAGSNRESVGALSLGRNLTARWVQASSGRLSEREVIEGRSHLFRTLMGGLGQILRIGLIAVGIWLVLGNALTLGGIFAARVMAGFGFRIVERAVSNWRSLTMAQRAHKDLAAYLGPHRESAVALPEDIETAELILDDVSFRYPGQRSNLLRNLNVSLKPGEMLLVSGKAATGKTTLSRLVLGLLVPRTGKVRLGEVEVASLPDHLRARMIGYLPQHTELFAGTVMENIGRFGQGAFEDVVAAARMAGLHDMIMQLPGGYQAQVGADALGGLSGSQRKRLALARAVFRTPRLIVMDEPSANLDSPSRREMEAALKQLKEAGCTLVVTQSVHSAQLSAIADKHLILGGGTREPAVLEGTTKSAGVKAKSVLRSVK